MNDVQKSDMIRKIVEGITNVECIANWWFEKLQRVNVHERDPQKQALLIERLSEFGEVQITFKGFHLHLYNPFK